MCDEPGLASRLGPLLDAWRPDYDPAAQVATCAAVRRLHDQIEVEGVAVYETGRQSAIRPVVQRNGCVQVLEVPTYISAHLVHALPSPECSHLLGDVATMRSVDPDRVPPPGFGWFVVLRVPGLGRRLRLWDSTDWPEDTTVVDWSAVVEWWNRGAATGWGALSALADDPADDLNVVSCVIEEAPDEVLAQLLPTPGLEKLLARRAAKGATDV